MQSIAREMNYSETTFILSDAEEGGGYNVRIFTPEREIPFAGHPALGTAYVIQKEIIGQPVSTVVLNLKVGQIPVTLNYRGEEIESLVMKQLKPTFGETFAAAEMAAALQLRESEVDDRFPIQEVSTGMPFIIVPLKSLEAVRRAKIDKEKYFPLIQDKEAKAILIFSPQTYHPENQLNVRVFADYYGVPEDPATGSGNGCLAGYLVRHEYYGTRRIDLRVEQGYEIGRPSLLWIRAEERSDGIEVYVGGSVVMVAKGELL
jgi:trans-2,3-dihydro-3-hydroxyanthranilate isomerase